MTQPKNAIQRGDDRYYTFDGDPTEYLSVTTVISRGKPKNLWNWVRQTTAEYAVEHHTQWASLPTAQAVDLIKNESNRKRDAAGHRGDEAHKWLEERMRGRRPDRHLIDPAAQIYVDAVERFIGETGPKAIELERTVRHAEHGYAGSFDGIYQLPGWPGLTLLDAKTSAGIYDEVALQLAAYRYAPEFTVDDEWYAMPHVDRCAVLWLRPGCDNCDTMSTNTEADTGQCSTCGAQLVGRYKVVEINAGPEAFDAFVSVLQVAKWSTDGWRGYKGHTYSPPRDLSAERRTNLIDRINSLDDAAKQALAAIWPAGVPTFRQQPRHTVFELDQITEAVEHVEADVSAPFNPPPLPERPGSLASVTQLPVDELAPSELIGAVIARLKRLPGDLLACVEANVGDKVPNLRTGRVTIKDLEMLDRELAAAEVEHQARVAELTSALSPLGEDFHAAICRTVGCPTDITKIGELEAEQVLALADDAVLGPVLLADYSGDGACRLHLRPDVLDHLVDVCGGKRAVLDTAKTLNERLRLGVSVRSSADAAGDIRLAALLAAQA